MVVRLLQAFLSQDLVHKDVRDTEMLLKGTDVVGASLFADPLDQ